MDRLLRFLNADDSIRSRAAWISMGIGFAWGIMSQGRGQPFRAAAYSAILVVGSAYVFQILWYCWGPTVELATRSSIGISRRFIWAIPSFTVITLLNIVPLPVVEAAVVNDRLRSLTRKQPLDGKALRTVDSMVTTAERNGIPLSSQTKNQVRSAIVQAGFSSPDLTAQASKTGATLASYVTKIEPPPANIRLIIANAKPAEDHVDLVGIATEDLAAKIEGPGGSAELKFWYSSNLRPAQMVVHDWKISLDGYTLRNVILRNMVLRYDGGPLSMETVAFTNCVFELASHLNCLRFINAVSSAPSGAPVTLTLRLAVPPTSKDDR